MFKKYLYPEITPFKLGYLKTPDSENEIYYEVSGNPNGYPILYVHGGPGGGTSEVSRRYFDPEKYKIILFDQRGCGKSKPSMSLKNNTTDFLIKDIEMIREHLKIEKWSLFGGSWGTTLSLVYAINFPKRVDNLILRGTFLARKQDLIWLYQDGTNYFNPTDFERYINIVPIEKRNDVISAYYEMINSNDKEIRKKALIEWARWESINATILDKQFDEKDLKSVFEIALIENHYFKNNCFFEENYILNNINVIKNIPTFIVHGSHDLICWPINSYLLHKNMNNSELYFIENAGHSQREEFITKKLVEITDSLIK